MIKILLIEDDIELATLLQRMLLLEGIDTIMAFHPVEGLKILEHETFDALVLDLSLPQIDGLEICRMVRAQLPNLPIIISSARSDTVDKIIGFELGADDYLPKPYEPIELAFRLRAILRRGIQVKTSAEVFSIDKNQHIIKRNNRELQLTKAEYDIMAFMLEKEGLSFQEKSFYSILIRSNFKVDSKALMLSLGVFVKK